MLDSLLLSLWITKMVILEKKEPFFRRSSSDRSIADGADRMPTLERVKVLEGALREVPQFQFRSHQHRTS